MSQRQRVFVAAAGDEAMAEAATGPSSGDAVDATAATAPASAIDDACEVVDVKVTHVVRRAKRARWEEEINAGRELTMDDLFGPSPIGTKALLLYLAAMRVTVSRTERLNPARLRDLASEALGEMEGNRWSKVSRVSLGS